MSPDEEQVSYFMTPVRSDNEWSAEQVVQNYVGRSRVYAFAAITPCKNLIKKCDWICFYVVTRGVVAHARVINPPHKQSNSPIRNQEKYPLVFDLDNVNLYIDKPIAIDATKRGKLDAFKEKKSKRWAWFVQSTRRISQHDFMLLTSQR
ncbi:MAG: hypothetical protein ACXV7G_09645 [Halobacteriota archaeon]